MASSGIVQSVSGIVKAIAVDGTERVLQVGDRVLPNEQIVTGNTGVISIEFADGTTLDLGRNSVTILDDETINYEANLAPSAPTSEQAQLAEVEAMQKAIAEGEEFDPSKLEATAAGAPGAGGPGEDDGHTFVNVDYLQPTATPESGFETTGISTAFPETQEPLILNPEQQPIPVAEVEPPAEPPIEPPVDTVPTAGTTTVLLDEDDLIADEVLPAIFDALRVEFESSTGYVAVNPFAVGANDQADGDDLPPNSPTVLTGFLTADYGDNGPGSIVFNPASAQPAGMTSGGENIQYWISNDGHSLIGFIVNNQSGPTGGTLVRGVDTQVPTYAQIIFTAEITDATTMAFRTALYGPVDHLDVTTEDNLLFNLSFTVSDIDGDSAQGILLLNLDDDSPIVTINEFGVASLNVVEASGIDSAQSAVISLATDIQPGADGLGSSSTSYALALAGTADSGLVTTDGNHPITLVVSPDGQIVTGQYQDNGPQTAFTVSLVGNQVSLVSNVALEHANAPQNTEDDTLDLNGLINVVATVAVTDGDNDQVIAQDNTTTGLNLSFNDTDPTVNITTAATVDALAVTEASLQTGQDSATITAPVFTASAVDGYSSSTSYALALAGTADSGLVTTDGNHPITLVVSPDGQTVTGQYQDNGTQTAFTVSLVGNQVSLVSNVALEHANAPQNTEDDTLDLNGLIDVVTTVAVTDGDNDQVIAQHNTTTGLELTFNDTDPVSLTPTALHIIDLATANGTTENLHFLTGADGVQTVRFNFSDGDAARDVDGNRLSFNGEFLYLHYADNGTDFTRMEATTSPTLGSGEVGFWIDIDPDANTYTMHSNGVISNGTAITSAEIAEIGGGNSEWLAFIDLSKSTEDAFMTTKSGDSVNTNNAEIGISAGNSFTPTEGYRIDFVNGLTTDKVQGVETYNISGAHNLTNSFRQVLSTVNPGNNDNGGVDGRADITLAAIIANDVDNIFYGDADDVLISLNPSNVNVYDSNGNIVPDGQQGLSYIDNGDTITLLGLQEDWTFEIETDVKFNAVQVDAYDTTAEFKLGLFSYGEDYFGDPVDLSYQITGIDGDGDMVDGQINAVLYPADATFDGSDLDDTYQGSDTVDYLLGNEGDDNLSGLDGDDVLVGGEGTDTLTGGGGSDRFVMTNGDVPDVIKDFTVGNLNSENGAIDPNADILDVTDVLAGAEITSSDFSANPANYLHLDTTTQPGSTIVSLDLDGSGAGLSLMTVVTLEGTETDLDTLLDNGQIDYS